MKKRIVSLLLTLCLVCSLLPGAAIAASDKATEAANALYELGLFSGTGTDANGNPIYDLDRAPTRQEAIVMLVRLLGKVDEATNGSWTMPFTDVADWAKPYVGYAYSNNLTFGVSQTAFGSGDSVSASQYLTFVLRALGYESGTDFQWDKAWELSDKIGMTNGEYNSSSNFLRGDVAIVSNNALHTNLKGASTPLIDTLPKQANENLYTKENLQGVWRKTDAKHCGEYIFNGSQFMYAAAYLASDKETSNDIIIDGQIFSFNTIGLSSGTYEAYDGSLSMHYLMNSVLAGYKTDLWVDQDILFTDKDTFYCRGIGEYKRVSYAVITPYCQKEFPSFVNSSEQPEQTTDYSYLAVNGFLSVQNDYPSATPILAYQVQYTNLDGEACVITDVIYKIISNYEHYSNLKGYYTTTNAFFEFCQNPTGSFAQVKDTINNYKNDARDYRNDLAYIFED